MADANDASQTGANSQEATVVPPSTEAQNQSETPPASENTGTEQSSEQKVPYQRFHEVVEQKNREKGLREQYETRIRELEARSQVNPQVHVDNEVSRLVKNLGMSEEAAREIVSVQQAVAQRERQAVEQRIRQMEVREWSNNLSSKFKDYNDLVPQMEKMFDALPPETQSLVVSSPQGLEMLYAKAKADLADGKLQESYNQGANQAYANKAAKQAATSIPGASAKNPGTRLTRAMIPKLSNAEYLKRQSEVNQLMAEGNL